MILRTFFVVSSEAGDTPDEVSVETACLPLDAWIARSGPLASCFVFQGLGASLVTRQRIRAQQLGPVCCAESVDPRVGVSSPACTRRGWVLGGCVVSPVVRWLWFRWSVQEQAWQAHVDVAQPFPVLPS